MSLRVDKSYHWCNCRWWDDCSYAYLSEMTIQTQVLTVFFYEKSNGRKNRNRQQTRQGIADLDILNLTHRHPKYGEARLYQPLCFLLSDTNKKQASTSHSRIFANSFGVTRRSSRKSIKQGYLFFLKTDMTLFDRMT